MHDDLPIRMVLHPTLVEIVHVTLNIHPGPYKYMHVQYHIYIAAKTVSIATAMWKPKVM